ncbi:hypothetical protein Tco_0896011 [Tanacetum coccineum]
MCHHLSGATWHNHCSGTVTEATTRPPVNDGGQWWPATVNDGQWWRTTVDHRRTTGQPPPNYRSTIAEPSVNGRASPGMERKDKASLGKGDGVQPMEEQKFQRQASHSYYNQGRNRRPRRSHVRTYDFESSY